MGRTWITVRRLAATLLVAAAFATIVPVLRAAAPSSSWLGVFDISKWWKKEPSLKPPPHPEEFTLPPETDSRFSKPIVYPEGTLNRDDKRKEKQQSGFEGPGRPGTGAGMRPY